MSNFEKANDRLLNHATNTSNTPPDASASYKTKVTTSPPWVQAVLRDEELLRDIFTYAAPQMDRATLAACLTASPKYYDYLMEKVTAAKPKKKANKPQTGYMPSDDEKEQSDYDIFKSRATTKRPDKSKQQGYSVVDSYSTDDDEEKPFAKPLSPNLPKFHGKEFESFKKFEKDLEKYCFSVGCKKKSNPHRQIILGQALQGYPGEMFEDLSPAKQNNYEYVMDMLRRAYGKSNKDRAQLLHNVGATKYTDYEDLSAYAADKMRQFRYAGIEGDDRMMYFVNGLPDHVRTSISLFSPQTLHEAWEIARKVLSVTEGRKSSQVSSVDNKRVSFRSNSPYPYSNKSDYRNRSSSRDRNGYDRRGRSPNRRQDYKNGRRSNSRDTTRSPSNSRRDSRSRSRSTGDNYRNRSSSRDNKKSYCKICNDYQEQGKHTAIQCHKCKNYGHVMKDCKAPFN